MKRVFTREHIDFIRGFVSGHSTEAVVDEFNHRFPSLDITALQIKNLKHRLHVRNGLPHGRSRGFSNLFPSEVCEYLRQNNRGRSRKEIQDMLWHEFGRDYTLNQIKSIRSRLHLNDGLTGRFQKGNVPWSRGNKGLHLPNAKGLFKKGHTPHNKLPVGTEVMATIGYIKVKVADPNVWRFKHIIEWERHNGKVPDGCCILFKDGDHRNCSIENLTCVSKGELAIMNNQKLRFANPELTEAALALVRLKHKMHLIKNKK